MTEETVAPHVVVAILTYRRPSELRRALTSLAEMEQSIPFDVLVVDNDADGSAKATVTVHSIDLDLRIRYVIEPKPGIAAARNRAIDESAAYDFLCFIDDDEMVEPSWLPQMIQTATEEQADMVCGPVHSEFDAPPPRWAVLGRFYSDFSAPDKSLLSEGATNNIAIRMHSLGKTRFDNEFGLSGGSDVLFTREMTARGARLVWTEDARVFEMVPVSRTRKSWIIRRAVRGGGTHGRVELALVSRRHDRRSVRFVAERVRVCGKGLARIAGGGLLIISHPRINTSPTGARGLRTLLRGVGMTGAAFDKYVVEYKR